MARLREVRKVQKLDDQGVLRETLEVELDTSGFMDTYPKIVRAQLPTDYKDKTEQIWNVRTGSEFHVKGSDGKGYKISMDKKGKEVIDVREER